MGGLTVISYLAELLIIATTIAFHAVYLPILNSFDYKKFDIK